MPNGNYVSYYRVSTSRQGESGLGLEAQQQAVKQYLNGDNWQILAEYTEVESGGKHHNRPMLLEAIAMCKKAKATLIIAKLDRLARNVHFVSGLMESGVEFVAVDNPHANKLMIHLLAAFAEHEREQISKRTSAALQAAKQRGVQLGTRNPQFLAKRNHDKAMEHAATLAPVINTLKAEGYRTTRAIVSELNRRQIPTFGGAGRQWHIPTVHTLLKRIDALAV